jgi:hypothetical protein
VAVAATEMAPARASATEAALARVRKLCLALPETSERLSHGAPAFFIRAKHSFVMFVDDHHGDGRLAIWCDGQPGVQAMLVEAEPDQYFVPPYVGPSGWLGVRLDRRPDWKQVAGLIEQAYQARVARLKSKR